eukprot:352638_1
MALFTCYDHEEEHLIFETRLRIKDIFIQNPVKSTWIGQSIIKRLSLYDLLIHGNHIHSSELLTDKNQRKLAELLQSSLDNNKLSSYTKSSYVNALIDSILHKHNEIWINMEQININLTNDTLKTMFILNDMMEFGTFIRHLITKFNVIVYPIFTMKWKMNENTFSLISRVSGTKHKNMKVVVVGPIVECNIFKDKIMTFQPEFTKFGSIFQVKMRLLSTLNQSPAKVHFNIECESVNNYYATLHPTTVDVKWNNSVYIELPPIELNRNNNSHLSCSNYCKRNTEKPNHASLLSIQVDIMMHDADVIKNACEKKLINAMDMMVMADMTASNQSYKFADILSSFYGLSNSVISILDSTSDIIFIVFLATQHDEIANFLLVLMIGNLISVAVGIAFYVTTQAVNERRIQSWRGKEWFLCFAFFILSPCLPAFEWLLQKLSSYTIDVLMVSPSFDPMLLWFEEEIARNRIFIGEAIFESSFQIVIQFIAAFVLQSIIYKHVYFVSIIISLLVIISKFILISYNLKRKLVFFNLLCYGMDIFFSLAFGIFIGALLFHKVFTFIGIWMVLEIITLVPFSMYLIGSTLSSWLYFPFLLIFSYPLTTCVISGFSIFPIMMHLQTQPHKIGCKQKFHQELFNYCCNSVYEWQFDMKLVIINYICIQSYFPRLREADNPKYYQFAKDIHKTRPNKLSDVKLMISSANFGLETNNGWISDLTSMAVYIKRKQFLVRSLLLIICFLMDVFLTKTFHPSSMFMYHYREIILGFGITGLIVFILWAWQMYYSYFSKWNKFSRYMIASKHEAFVLSESIEEFISKCNDLMPPYSFSGPQLQTTSQIFASVPVKFPRIDFEIGMWDVMAITLQSLIILLLILIAYFKKTDDICWQSKEVIFIYNVVMISVSLVICFVLLSHILWRRIFENVFWIACLKAVLFSLFVSSIMVYFYMMYFYESGCNDYQTLIVSLQFIGGLICFSVWNCAVSVAFLISYGILLAAGIHEWYYIIVLTFGILILFGSIYTASKHIKYVARICTHIAIFIFPVSIFIGKDIACLIINAYNTCGRSIERQSKYVPFGVDTWILIGCVIHTSVLLCVVCSIQIGYNILNYGNFYSLLQERKVVLCIIFIYVFFFAWSVIGVLLYGETKTAELQCSAAIIAWSILQLIETCTMPCIWYSILVIIDWIDLDDE